MQLAETAVRRPVLAVVMSLLILICDARCFMNAALTTVQSARKPKGPYPVASQTVLYKYSDEDLITRVVSLQ